MIWRRIWSNSIKNRLTFLFFSITAGAICVIYFYVVPQLESSLTSQRLDGLERDSVTYSRPLQQTGARDVLASKLKSVVRTLSEKSGSRVTLLGIPVDERAVGRVGDAPPYVITDSQEADTTLDPSYALVLVAARSGHLETGTTAENTTTQEGLPRNGIGRATWARSPPFSAVVPVSRWPERAATSTSA